MLDGEALSTTQNRVKKVQLGEEKFTAVGA